MKHDFVKLTEEMIATIDGYINALKDFIQRNGVDKEIQTMDALVDAVKSLRVVLKDKYHLGLTFDENGYITKAQHFEDFVAYPNEDAVPTDLAHGFYLLLDGTVAIDEERKRQIEEV
jgi:hypothetical protein